MREVTDTLRIVPGYLEHERLTFFQDNICRPGFNIDAIHFPESRLLNVRRVVVSMWEIFAVQRIGSVWCCH